MASEREVERVNEHEPAAVAVYPYRRRDSSVDLLQLRRTGTYAGTWQNVYGSVEPGETAVQAALRELREEVGQRPRRLVQVEHLESFYLRPLDRILIMPVFAAELDPEAEVVLNAEHDASRWVPAEEADRWFMWRSQREALRVLLEDLDRTGPAADLMDIPLR